MPKKPDLYFLNLQAVIYLSVLNYTLRSGLVESNRVIYFVRSVV